MASTTAPPVTEEPPARVYSRLLLAVHDLLAQGKGDGEEAESLADEMDGAWYAMSKEEQDRMRGLSQDLYALAEGRKVREMSAEERRRWSEQAKEALAGFAGGDCDRALDLLRGAPPAGVPAHVIPFLQARCWEKLGLLEVAVRFMKETERSDTHQAVAVLFLLQHAGRAEEAKAYADRIAADPGSSPMEVYFAAWALASYVRSQGPAESRPVLERLVPLLRRAFKRESDAGLADQEVPGGGAGIAAMLGVCLGLAGRPEEAIAAYEEGLSRYPGDSELLTLRGLATYDSQPGLALEDFRKAVESGARSFWPYFFLAHSAIIRQQYSDCWKFCLAGLERGGPRTAQAQLHEWLGISRFMLGQRAELVFESFHRAQELDPGSTRIRSNKAIVERNLGRPRPEHARWGLRPRANLKRLRHPLLTRSHTEWEVLASRQGNRFADLLASA